MKFTKWCVVLLFVLAVLIGCNENSKLDSEDVSSSDYPNVVFINRGAVVPDPVVSTVTIDPFAITYNDSQSGNIINYWFKPLLEDEFDSLKELIERYDLLNADDVTLADGQEPMCGWQGMTIIIFLNDDVHSIDICGEVNQEQWPKGIKALIALKDQIYEKYKL